MVQRFLDYEMKVSEFIGLLILALGLVAWMITRYIDENKEDDQ